MSKRSFLAMTFGVAILLISAVIPGKTFAAVVNLKTENADPLNPAMMQLEYQKFAQRGGRGGRGGASAGAGAGRRPSGGRPGGPSARPGGGAGRRPGGARPGGNRNVNVNVRTRGRGWRGRYWGRVAFGVTLGTAIIVVANTPPYPPNPALCWTWANSVYTSGYWYYCDGP